MDEGESIGAVRLLVVEDDPSIGPPLREGLQREGFDVELVTTGRAALEADRPDLVLLDLGLPDLDGRVVCRELRALGDTPIIVVTARSDEIDRVTLLELGADDYVVKPFGFRELVARIRAVLRRSAASSAGPDEDGPIELHRLEIEPRSRAVRHDGEPVDLTPREYDLLRYLASEPDMVRTRGEIMQQVWDENWWGSTKTLDVHIASLRKKLHPEIIQTIRGVGFMLRSNGETA